MCYNFKSKNLYEVVHYYKTIKRYLFYKTTSVTAKITKKYIEKMPDLCEKFMEAFVTSL